MITSFWDYLTSKNRLTEGVLDEFGPRPKKKGRRKKWSNDQPSLYGDKPKTRRRKTTAEEPAPPSSTEKLVIPRQPIPPKASTRFRSPEEIDDLFNLASRDDESGTLASDEDAGKVIREEWRFTKDDDDFVKEVIRQFSKMSDSKMSVFNALRLRYELLAAKDSYDKYKYTEDIVPEVKRFWRGGKPLVYTDLPLKRKAAFEQMRELRYRPEDLNEAFGKSNKGEQYTKRLVKAILHGDEDWDWSKHSFSGHSWPVDATAKKTAVKTGKVKTKEGKIIPTTSKEKIEELMSRTTKDPITGVERPEVDWEIWLAFQKIRDKIISMIDKPGGYVKQIDLVFLDTKREPQGSDIPAVVSLVKQKLRNLSGIENIGKWYSGCKENNDILNTDCYKSIIQDEVWNALRLITRKHVKKGTARSVTREKEIDPNTGEETGNTKAISGKEISITGADDSEGTVDRTKEPKSKEINPAYGAIGRLDQQMTKDLIGKIIELAPTTYSPNDLEEMSPEEIAAIYRYLMSKVHFRSRRAEVPEDPLEYRTRRSTVAPPPTDQPPAEQMPNPSGMASRILQRLRNRQNPPPDLAHRKYSFLNYIEMKQQEAMIVGATKQSDAGPSAGGVWGSPESAARLNKQARKYRNK